ncbi:hypothetical protein [Novipirellula galeiformis]|nr:hypothetical protein [Novipirellula galeiformis]
MSRKKNFTMVYSMLLGASICLPIVGANVAIGEDAPEEKPSIKAVMKACFKGPLVKKVVAGKASDDEKKELHAMLVAMSETKPPRGSDESWQKLNKALRDASEKMLDGDAAAANLLNKAANCKACHSEHKPK